MRPGLPFSRFLCPFRRRFWLVKYRFQSRYIDYIASAFCDAFLTILIRGHGQPPDTVVELVEVGHNFVMIVCDTLRTLSACVTNNDRCGRGCIFKGKCMTPIGTEIKNGFVSSLDEIPSWRFWKGWGLFWTFWQIAYLFTGLLSHVFWRWAAYFRWWPRKMKWLKYAHLHKLRF